MRAVESMRKQFEMWRSKQIYFGDTPEAILRTKASLLNIDEVRALLRDNKRKLSNVNYIQKFFWWILTTISVALIATGIVGLRNIAQTLPNVLGNAVGVFFVAILGYLIFVTTIAVVIQSLKNSVENRVEILQEVLDRKEEKNETTLVSKTSQ